MSLPPIAVTLGDPAGIGPEVAIKALPEVVGICRPILFGNLAVVRQACQTLRLPLPLAQIEEIDTGELEVVPGKVSAACGRASFGYVEAAIRQTMQGHAAALVTGPIQKEAWHAAGITFPGHTELLADRCQVPAVRMMLCSDAISCVLVTVHVGYRDVPDLLTIENVTESIRMADRAWCQMHRQRPRITVCGLNPHAGEHGLFGNQEEERVIAPAVEIAASAGIDVKGPLPADTAFTAARRRKTDVYVCMYHDQGLIPLKTLAFDDAVNVTLGLPIVRTSVDHGTAMEIAGQGIASHNSMVAAIRMAVELSAQ